MCLRDVCLHRKIDQKSALLMTVGNFGFIENLCCFPLPITFSKACLNKAIASALGFKRLHFTQPLVDCNP